MAVLALSLAACSDDYDDTALWEQVNDNTNRIEALEQWQDKVNNNITALQQLLNTTDYITSVTPVTKDGKEVGYTISFRNSDPITIYHGEKGDKGDKGDQGEQGIQGEPGKDGADGADGSDGKDGYTPQIGLTQQADGNWYWTLDGEPMLDPNGDPIRANGDKGDKGEQGEDGDKGDTGDTGASAPTPQIKLGSTLTGGTYYGIDGTEQTNPDAGAWYLSVDGGKTWYRISGKEGAQGNPGSEGQQGPKGDSMFEGKPELSNDGTHYIFTLANNGGTIKVAAYQHFQILTDDEHKGSGTFGIDIAPVRAEGETTFYLSMNAETDYKAIVAEVTPLDDDAVLTRIASEWSAAVQEAADGNITVTVTAPADGKALLDVSLIREDGSKVTASRVLEALGFTIADDATYIVYTAGGLQAWAIAVQSNPSLNCTLADNITLSEATESGSNWTTIGTYTGTFDGNDKTITGLAGTAGLFDKIDTDGEVKNLKLEGVKITESGCGAIARESSGTITACSVSGSVAGSSNSVAQGVGGIVGYNNAGTVSGCSMKGTVTNSGTNVGGIVGYSFGGNVIDCHSSATVTGTTIVGGVIGKQYGINAKVIASSSTGNVTSTRTNDYSFVGGVVGHANVSFIICCYATGDISGEHQMVGGVVGYNRSNVVACYYAGSNISGVSAVGGVVGENEDGTITSCYWSDYAGNGIGNDITNAGETTKVDGAWTDAVSKMNNALADYDWEWSLDTTNPYALPTLVKKESRHAGFAIQRN